MLRIAPSRARPSNRTPTESDKTPAAKAKSYGAPTSGLVTNLPLAAGMPASAIELDNFWPTSTGLEPRGGSALVASIEGPVETLFQYQAGALEVFFAADAGNIYAFDGDTSGGAELSPVVTGQTSGDYSDLHIQNQGGSFLCLVNGADPMQLYDGASWQQVTDSSSPHAITGVDTATLSYTWAYRNRQFFIQSGTMNAWYLGVNSVSGIATILPLAGVFNRGGSLLFGATWSSDSGAGMDDRCVFATDQGEFAVYAGDPSDLSTWALTGVYTIGKPLGKRAHMTVGGDLIVATHDGLIPISAATSKDPSQLTLSALSIKIEGNWRNAALGTYGGKTWALAKWSAKNMALVLPPVDGDVYCWAVNLTTGAWTKFSGWAAATVAVLGDGLYYGDSDGTLVACDVGGSDQGSPFECRACFAFDHLEAPGALKVAHLIRSKWRHGHTFASKHSIASDYRPNFPTLPAAAIPEETTASDWDEAIWDEAYWNDDRGGFWSASGDWDIAEKWESISGHGEVLAPQVQVISAQDVKLACELISLDLTYTVGAVPHG